MPRDRRETNKVKLHRTEPEAPSIRVEEPSDDGIFVVVTQVFCPNGHNLVGRSSVEFDGYPGISLWVEGAGTSGEVVVSPIHGDHRKEGVSFPAGTKLTLRCPECKTELEALTDCGCPEHGVLRVLYLTPQCSEAHIIAVCDVWGCPLSRVIDSYEMFSEFLEGNIGGEDRPGGEA